MAQSKLVKSPNLGVIFQLTEVEADAGVARQWEVHDVERNRGFKLRLAAAPDPKIPPETIEQRILLALERELQSPPEKVPGGMYEVELRAEDLSPAPH